MHQPLHHITITKLDPKDWQQFKDIRLQALSSDPDAFESTYTETLALPDDYWMSRLQDTEWICLFAEDHKQIIGMIAAHIKPKDNTANIYSVYLHKAYRGIGIGKKMMHAILDEVEKHTAIRKVQLSILANNNKLLEYYESLGFIEIAKKEDEIEREDGFVDELILEKFL
jgi:ribosomal protein S18 acetylase RimI-like enzyme